MRLPLLIASAIAFSGPACGQPPYALLGKPAPDFALRAVDGPNVRLSEHIGQVVIVSFWASGCDSCRAQLAALDRDFNRYRSKGLRVYGVEVDDHQRAALRFARRTRVSFPLLLDPPKAVARAFRVDNLPMTVLIGRGGNIRYLVRDFNESTRRLCDDELASLLAE